MEASRQLGLPFVHEVILLEEPQDPGEPGASPEPVTYQRVLFHYKLGWHNNDVEWLDVANEITKAPEVEADVIAGDIEAYVTTFDYTSQLQFHEYELSQAEKRGMPPAQVAYHFDRLCLLRKMGASYGN